MKSIFIIFALLILFNISEAQQKGSVIFIHPDGTGVGHYNAARNLYYGPDGMLNWDMMTHTAVYKCHIKDNISASSNAGATVHAYGVKVHSDAYGLDEGEEIISRSGKKMSIMQEAIESGIKTGLINTGSVIEPGTGAFVAQVTKRRNFQDIAYQIVESGVNVIFAGGEEWYLPVGTEGIHTKSGKRKDSLNLIETAKQKGYTIIYTREELINLPLNTEKVIGIFSESHTFNDKTEEQLRESNLQNYKPNVPTVREMTEAALKILSRDGNQFFLVIEEEGTDNFSNVQNASGTLEALKRADDAIGTALDFINKNPNTLLLTGADSDAGGLISIEAYSYLLRKDGNLVYKFKDSGPIDGARGTGTEPFETPPDKDGKSRKFAVVWATMEDITGSVIWRAEGLNSERMKGTIDNTEIYKIMYLTLFGIDLK
ncbi:MAG: alkaline phosphatase [Ignavibacteria bacterium]|nr:alkaline phosphatase [Ignavibacteria bacterium]